MLGLPSRMTFFEAQDGELESDSSEVQCRKRPLRKVSASKRMPDALEPVDR
jgi:hypothetical protein